MGSHCPELMKRLFHSLKVPNLQISINDFFEFIEGFFVVNFN